MADLDSLPRENWLFIPKDATVSMEMMCREVATDDYTAEEMDYYCETNRLKWFFYKDQLEDIVSNLREQTPHPTLDQVEAAIIYYWVHDAFIPDLERDSIF